MGRRVCRKNCVNLKLDRAYWEYSYISMGGQSATLRWGQFGTRVAKEDGCGGWEGGWLWWMGKEDSCGNMVENPLIYMMQDVEYLT